MRHGSLFSGIGGFDLASEWMGWENIFHCEIEPFPKKILQHYWPNADSLGDIKKTDFKKYEGQIDIISGGFPCQPYSAAGKRKGKEDDRHLWPEMLRAIREIKPRWIVGENVYGLINWNGGLVFEEIHTDLETEGYEVWAVILPAVSKDAPHRRDRIWFIANSNNTGLQRRKNNRITPGIGQKSNQQLAGCFWAEWQKFPTQPPVCGGNDGLPSKLDGITFSKWRNESIKSYGNAVVPQVVYEIFKTIQRIDLIH
jgi:DNA (cytosine-5)-methyltransferase 1